MTNVIKIKRGLNIDIAGAPAPVLASMNQSALVAISPDDFNGIVPKVLVKEGEKVRDGEKPKSTTTNILLPKIIY